METSTLGQTQSISGRLSKLKVSLSQTKIAKEKYLVDYRLPVGDNDIALAPFLGKTFSLTFTGKIHCIYCGQLTKKSYNQGYCFPCCQKLARCDLCIVRPETCHYQLGTCREPSWALQHCFIPHIVYLANTSGLKVGITRENQIPTRWIDQGAIQALPLFKTSSRYIAGLVEVALKAFVNDKTDWRKMLKSEGESLDMLEKRDLLLQACGPIQEKLNVQAFKMAKEQIQGQPIEQLFSNTVIGISYPVLQYPEKVVSLNIEKTPEIKGTLLGIKGQYLLFDTGVLNIRNLSGHILSVN